MATRAEIERLELLLRGQAELLQEVHLILGEEQKHDDVLRAAVLSSMHERPVHIRGLEPERVFHRESIRRMCIRYRLRFLPGGAFKGSLPAQAVHGLRVLERRAAQPLQSFMILAPASRFRLCDSEADPLLFVPVGEDRFYLVHKWGNDLAASRALLNWPFRSPVHLGVFVLLVALAFTLCVPTSIMGGAAVGEYLNGTRFLLFFWSTMVCASFTVFAWFAFFGQFSSEAWNSRYFNA